MGKMKNLSLKKISAIKKKTQNSCIINDMDPCTTLAQQVVFDEAF